MWIKLRSTTLVPIFVVINYQSSLICIIMVSKCSLKVEKGIWKIWNNGVCFVLFLCLNKWKIAMRSAVVLLLLCSNDDKWRQKRRSAKRQSAIILLLLLLLCRLLQWWTPVSPCHRQTTTNARQPSPNTSLDLTALPSINVIALFNAALQSGQTF